MYIKNSSVCCYISSAMALLSFFIFFLFLLYLFIYLFGVLHPFEHYTGHIMTGSWKGRGNQYIQFVRVLYCKLLTNGKQLPAFPLKAMTGIEPRPQMWEARVLPLCHCGYFSCKRMLITASLAYMFSLRFSIHLPSWLHPFLWQTF